ncbi:transglutaminase-like cysteine peptidase [Bradyrhizobium sp. AZCC 2289]|uniref:transglutaminase-like cysteine peptidase n=1 Tax=Bradyrhizobium sp. AZCC 2289 TaxID=3117026 RepID=UPI002FF05962
MTSRRESLKLASSILLTACALSISLCTAPHAFAADQAVIADAGDGLIPGSDRTSTRPPATFFSINDVLAKLDRQRGRGPNALRMAALSPSNSATDAQPQQKEAPPVGKEPFGLFTFRAPEGILWRKWRGIEGDIAKEQVILNNCRAKAESCPSYAAQFLRLINAVKAQSGRGQLDEANRAINMAIRYVSDFAQHGEADRWSAPLATFATGKGDCEDYAIAKYVALSEAGFPRDDLQLVLVRDRAVRQDHAVLAARLDGHWLILDSRRAELMDDSDATSFTPLFAIDHRGVQLFAAPYAKRPLLVDEVEAAPAATSDSGLAEWTGQDAPGDSFAQLNSLPLLM